MSHRLLVFLALLASTAAAAASAVEKPPTPVAPTTEAICGEYAIMLNAQRHQLELALAEARAHVKVLQAAREKTPEPATP